MLQSWFMYIHNLFEFWFISFHVNFLKAYLNWFSNWSSKFKFVYNRYCWIFRHQNIDIMESIYIQVMQKQVYKEYPWIPWELRYVFGNSDLLQATTFALANSSILWTNQRAKKFTSVNFCDVANVIARVKALCHHWYYVHR